jgi:hypothetical protein
LQQKEPHPQPKQMKTSGVQAVINGEDRKVNNAYKYVDYNRQCN